MTAGEHEEYLLNETAHEDQHTGADHSLSTTSDHSRNCRRLYISHALSTWNARIFEFGAFLFLASIWPQSLLPASIYALARAASAAILSPWLGPYIDRSDRLKVVRFSILGQRIPVAVSCMGFFLLLQFHGLHTTILGKAMSLFILSVLACVEKLSAVMNTISIERDWVVVIAEDDEGSLATLNAEMRRIDLFCKLVGPLVISSVDSKSIKIAIVITGSMSSVSSVIEYLAVARVYHSVPSLRMPKDPPKDPPAIEATTGTTPAMARLRHAIGMLATYIRHPAFLPSLSLALLYLTVLSFSGQLITYLLALGLSSASIAALRGLAALFELSATWLGPHLTRRIGAVRAGIWFLNFELLFVCLACAYLWLPLAPDNQSSLVTFGLVAAVILSRTGLWGFDLSAQVIVQDEVEPAMRGTFSSLEFSLQNLFEMLGFASTIVFPRPEQFRYPALVSAVAVALASVSYACFVRGRRGHLMHVSRCLEWPRGRKRAYRQLVTGEEEEGCDGVELEARG